MLNIIVAFDAYRNSYNNLNDKELNRLIEHREKIIITKSTICNHDFK